eukprot:6175925-Pleurochrysis_carterae.AAC.1
MTFHVVGIIFHGKPDSPHIFPAAPQLAGNSNLNCECFMRAVVKEYLARGGMLPSLHVQVGATAVVPTVFRISLLVVITQLARLA